MLKRLFLSNRAGILLALVITSGAYFLSTIISFNAVLLALVLGILVGNLVNLPDITKSGIKTSSGLILELAIILMAFGINYTSFITLGWQTILIIVATITAVLISTVQLSKVFKCPGSTGWLVGFGTAICGSSAIAALAPSISKDKTDIGIALAVVNLFGLLGMVVIPVITKDYLTDVQNGVLIGTSLHSVGNVAGAGASLSNAVGELAVTVKLGRVALLTPALLVISFFLGKKTNPDVKTKLNLPWYLVTFIVISVLGSIFTMPSEVLSLAKQSSNFLLAMAMAAIGLKVSFKTLLSSGKKGLIFGAVLFAIQLVVIAGLMWVFKT